MAYGLRELMKRKKCVAVRNMLSVHDGWNIPKQCKCSTHKQRVISKMRGYMSQLQQESTAPTTMNQNEIQLRINCDSS